MVVVLVVVVVVVVSEGRAGAVSLLERFGVRGSHHHYYAPLLHPYCPAPTQCLPAAEDQSPEYQ